MSQQELDAVIDNIQSMQSSWNENTTIETIRVDLENLYSRYPLGEESIIERVNSGGVPADFVSLPNVAQDRVVLYFHGGGFAAGSAKSHRHLAEWISSAANARVLVIDYRLVPEYRFPAQLEDAKKSYQWLLGQGYLPENISAAGDSAGGGLVLSLLAALRHSGIPLPGCGVLISAWADMTCSGASYEDNAAVDPVASREMALQMAEQYLGEDGDPNHPDASSINIEYANLPPLLIQVGTRDIFLDDSRLIAKRAQAGGVEVSLDEWPGMIHVWHLYASALDEGRQALENLGAFIRRHTGG